MVAPLRRILAPSSKESVDPLERDIVLEGARELRIVEALGEHNPSHRARAQDS
jgi:hypothetical protein